MKVRLLILVAAFALMGVFAIPGKTASAAGCVADPAVGPIGTTFQIYCSGFTPNTWLNAYFVEPDGAAVTGPDIKSDQYGQTVRPFFTKFGNVGATALGTYTYVIDEKGLANKILSHGEVTFRVTGGTEGVSGATLWSSDASITKSESTTIYGSGFQPGEVVTVWWEYPHGDCSAYTLHGPFINFPGIFEGLSTLGLGNLKVGSDGTISFPLNWFSDDCEGTYRIVARGNSSGNGAETWVTVTGNAVSTNAVLEASPNKAQALFDFVYFTGSGFSGNEPVSCWLTSPQGRAAAVYGLDKIFFKADNGNLSFSIYTGSLVPSFIYGSEGALGEYAMTCRGDVSGATAIARFTVTGNTLDP